MKLHILSDLHIETKAFTLPKTDADVLVLAGDINRAGKGIDWALESFPERPILYVMGNHEYHGYAMPSLTNEMREKTKGTRVHFLENDVTEIDGVSFFGATLWTDYNLLNDPKKAQLYAEENLKDHKLIRVDGEDRVLKGADKLVYHHRTREALESVGQVDVVITHHTPSVRSVPEKFIKGIRATSSASNMDGWVPRHAKKLWIHGHTHFSADYDIEGVRVVSNPRGYIPFEPNEKFDENFMVEV